MNPYASPSQSAARPLRITVPLARRAATAQQTVRLLGAADFNAALAMADAHAQLGQFTEAIHFANTALQVAADEDRARVERRLESFETQQPYRLSIADYVQARLPGARAQAIQATRVGDQQAPPSGQGPALTGRAD